MSEKNTISNIEQSQIELGTKHELEHKDTIAKFKKEGITDEQVAKSIAIDHLKEDPDYYRKLSRIENEGATGGEVIGKRHSECDEVSCGEQYTVKKSGQVVELEGGEGVMKVDAMDDEQEYVVEGDPRTIISCLNEMHGGRNFRNGSSVCRVKPKMAKGGAVSARKLHVPMLSTIGTKAEDMRKTLHNIAEAHFDGMHRDNWWKPIKAFYTDLAEKYDAEYTFTSKYSPNFPNTWKVWNGKVYFTGEDGRKRFLEYNITASGAGKTDYPLGVYDVSLTTGRSGLVEEDDPMYASGGKIKSGYGFGENKWTNKELELSGILKNRDLYLVKSNIDRRYIVYNTPHWEAATINNEVFTSTRLQDVEEFALRYADGGAITKEPREISRDVIDTDSFKKWFGDWENDPENASKVVDDSGEPLVVYHGTTHEWTIYSKERGNPENDLGIGFYATSDRMDAVYNYHSTGSDITSRVERRAEQIEEQAEMNDETISHEEALEIASKELVGDDEITMGVYLNLRNPVILSEDWSESTILDFSYQISEEDEDIYEPSELLEDFDKAINEAFEELRDNNITVWSITSEEIIGKLSEEGLLDDENKAIDIYRAIKSMYLYDNILDEDEGSNYVNEFIRLIFEKLGYDGIIYMNPSKHFPNMRIPENVKHYIAFYPNQIKSAELNTGEFDSSNPDIRYDDGGSINEYDMKHIGAKGSKYEGQHITYISTSPIPSMVIVEIDGKRDVILESDLEQVKEERSSSTESDDKKHTQTSANRGSKDIKIKEWYMQNYPTDDLGEEIYDTSTFEDLWSGVHNGVDIYEDVIGVGDSVVRERLFENLSKIKGVEYNYIYNKWLSQDDNPPQKTTTPSRTEQDTTGFSGEAVLQQLGGGRFAVMTGAKDFAVDRKNRALHFRIGRNKTSANRVVIRLNSLDLYDIEFGRQRGADYTIMDVKENIYGDQLQSVFTDFTGLYTKLAEGGIANGNLPNRHIKLAKWANRKIQWKGIVQESMLDSIRENQIVDGTARYKMVIGDRTDEPVNPKEIERLNKFFNKIGGRFGDGGEVFGSGDEVMFLNLSGVEKRGFIEGMVDDNYVIRSGFSQNLVPKENVLGAATKRKRFRFFEQGGDVAENIDLFENYEYQPPELAEIISEMEEISTNDGLDYPQLQVYLKRVESLGYTFEYGLDAIPYALRKKDVPVNQLEGYEDYEQGGTVQSELGLAPEKASAVFHLPFEMAVYVPSTQDVDKVISLDEMEQRASVVKKYLASIFGGYTSAETVGGFVDSNGNLVNEEVIKVTAFSTKDDFENNREQLFRKISEWAKDWGQEAIGFEFEGDLYYVPESFKDGGVVTTRKYNKLFNKGMENINKGKKKSDKKTVIDLKDSDILQNGGLAEDEKEEFREASHDLDERFKDEHKKMCGSDCYEDGGYVVSSGERALRGLIARGHDYVTMEQLIANGFVPEAHQVGVNEYRAGSLQVYKPNYLDLRFLIKTVK